MKMDFNFDDVDLNKKATNADGSVKLNYIKLTKQTGDAKLADRVRTVKMTGCEAGSTTHGEPFIKVTVADTTGAVSFNDFFTNTEVKPGKQTSSFNVNKTDFVKFLVVTGLTEEKAKALLQAATSQEDLAAKLSTAIGKPFKMGFFGKITTKKDGTKFLKTMFSQGKNNILPVTSADTDINISPNKDETDNFYNGTTTATTAPTAVTNDLPF